MDVLSNLHWPQIIYSLLLVTIGFFIAKKLSNITTNAVRKRFSPHQVQILQKLTFYTLYLLFLLSALQQLGFKISILLGAAGVLTVALSFASQTAASNLVSGLFLLFERPFKIGDFIKIKDLQGTVETIDLLSTKIQTPDNMRIRVPNETIMKSDIINLSFYLTRRIDLLISIAYDSDVDHVQSVLQQLAAEHEDVHKDPAPQVMLNNFTDFAIEIKFMVWTQTDKVGSVRNQLLESIKTRFEHEHIDMSFSRLTCHQRT